MDRLRMKEMNGGERKGEGGRKKEKRIKKLTIVNDN